MKTIKTILIMAALLLATFAILNPTVKSVSTPLVKAVYDNPAYPPINPPKNFTLNIKVYNVTDLHDWEFKLRWNPYIVSFLNITEGNWNATATGGDKKTDFIYYLSPLGEYVQAYSGFWANATHVDDAGTGLTLAKIGFNCYDTGDNFNFTFEFTHLWEHGSLIPIDHDTDWDLLWATQLPVVKYSYTPTAPDVGTTVTFNASKSYAQLGKIIADFTWDFGDGNSSYSSGTNPVVKHSYANFGTYTTKCTVTDSAAKSWSRLQTLKIWRDVTAIDMWPCPWWWYYILGYEPYEETSILPGDWLFKGEILYVEISFQNLGTLTQNYKVQAQLVRGANVYELTGLTKVGTWMTLPLNLTLGPDAKCRIADIMDTTGVYDGTKIVQAPGNFTYVIRTKVTAPLDQNTGNDIYEYTISFFLRVMGDSNKDGIADGGDLGILGLNWYAAQSSLPPYPDEYCNFTRMDGDDLIDGGDLGILGLHWYESS
jgi:PKD repeat protein